MNMYLFESPCPNNNSPGEYFLTGSVDTKILTTAWGKAANSTRVVNILSIKSIANTDLLIESWMPSSGTDTTSA
eukprot:CAMPEP_0114371294 /NCGR_PEP_ID=MMETSP0101-20121206/33199_1 /TAXON_ID=38822 ORGANISM="Pteridomonas danica, Strain PT" /NCGR_SAMPLE_ID=MMETSP0101 /ASSEMBLY_ACC=CAM_ASM_000211 /LENGTH=73 /DNA_ID=CAMNT_0001523345 /DNA_START=43 /DNA_END=260 /DNA_ORIENTATION=+